MHFATCTTVVNLCETRLAGAAVAMEAAVARMAGGPADSLKSLLLPLVSTLLAR